MDREIFDHWLASYGRAWTRRDPEAAASLYADDGTYQVTPFDEPLRGRAAIYEYWAGVAKTEERIRFDYEILSLNAAKHQEETTLLDLLVRRQRLVNALQGLESVFDHRCLDVVFCHQHGFQQDGRHFYLAIAHCPICVRLFALRQMNRFFCRPYRFIDHRLVNRHSLRALGDAYNSGQIRVLSGNRHFAGEFMFAEGLNRAARQSVIGRENRSDLALSGINGLQHEKVRLGSQPVF